MAEPRDVIPAEILAFWRDAGPDRWYTRDAGELVGKFMLYRVKLR